MSEVPATSIAKLPQPGDVLVHKYKIERLIGQGGMGAVFVAEHAILHQPVAIKLLLPEIAENKEAATRFLNEARAAARIRNEHVAQVMDVGTLPDGSAFMVLEYLEGQDLSDLLESVGPLPITDAVDYIIEALEAVAQAHALGIIHRDLKPANLFLAKRQDGSSIVKVLDFGISKATASANASVTATKALLGSPGYMSPEQVRSSRNVDARSDIWSIGVILYRLFTNTAPFEGDNLGAVFASILEDTPASIHAIRPEIPVELEAIVMNCLQRDRDKRFSNAGELAKALAPFASPDTALSVERICRTLAMPAPRRSRVDTEGTGARAVLSSTGADALVTGQATSPSTPPSKPAISGVSQGHTASTWADANKTSGRKKKTGLWIGAGVALVAIGVGAVGVKIATTTPPAAPSASAAAMVATTPSNPPPVELPKPSSTPEPTHVETSEPKTTPSVEPAPSASTPASAPTRVPLVPGVRPFVPVVPPKPTTTPPVKPTSNPDDILQNRH